MKDPLEQVRDEVMLAASREQLAACPINPPEGLQLNQTFATIRDDVGMTRVRRLPYGEPVWLATRYSDVRTVLADPRFSRATAAEHEANRLRPANMSTGILAMDPPEHTRLRGLLTQAFTMRRIGLLRPRIRALAEEFIEEMIRLGPPADLVERFALPISVTVICELLGVPTSDRTRFRVWSDNAMSTTRLTFRELEANQEELRDYMRDLIRRRRDDTRNDLITALARVHNQRDRLLEEEIVDSCVTILIAGHETTATQISNFVYMLSGEPRLWAPILASPELIPPAVEELLRFVPLSIGPGFPRHPTEDVDVGGVLVRAGDSVMAVTSAANRDPRRFNAPDELRFDRAENPHLGFGYGAHRCLGAHLARVELQEALRVLSARLPDIRLAGPIEWKTGMIVRGPRTMLVEW